MDNDTNTTNNQINSNQEIDLLDSEIIPQEEEEIQQEFEDFINGLSAEELASLSANTEVTQEELDDIQQVFDAFISDNSEQSVDSLIKPSSFIKIELPMVNGKSETISIPDFSTISLPNDIDDTVSNVYYVDSEPEVTQQEFDAFINDESGKSIDSFIQPKSNCSIVEIQLPNGLGSIEIGK